jgi:hypothetical protein
VANVYENLIPRTMSREILSVAGQQSAVLSLGRRLVMPTGLMSIPIVSFMPVAGWVNPRYGGRKPATKVEWTAQAVQAEECACVLALPNSYIDDAAFPAGGIAGLAGAAATGADAITAIDAAAVAVETSGGVPNGIAASTKIGGALRAAYRTANALPDQAPASQIYGWPVTVVREWDSTKGDALVGDWNYLLVGVREDITFDMSSEAILQDNTGAIIANSFQDDLTALRCYIRLGVAIGQPLDPGTDAPVAPLEFADWTTP